MGSDPPGDPGGGYDNKAALRNPFELLLNDHQMEVDLPQLKRRSEEAQNTNLPPSKKTINNTSTPSIQSTFTLPEFELNIRTYGEHDVAPFIVHISKVVSESTLANSSTLRPIKFGHFLFHNKIQGIVKDGIKRVGRNRISVEFKTSDDANSFLQHPSLAAAKYEAVIPSFNITRMGIIREVPVEWTLEELLRAVEVPSGFGKVIKARRLNRKSYDEDNSPVWIPTQTVVLTFLGQKLPPQVYCFYTSLPVQTYVLPTIQCNKCCRFGHIAAKCRSHERCFICAGNHLGISCTRKTPTCLFCSGEHKATDQNCPEQSRQRNIKLVMSQENISYLEASIRFPQVRKPFTDALRNSPLLFPDQSQSQPTQPSTQPTIKTSYNKTTFTQRRLPSPASSRGYDRAAHMALISSPHPSSPNGSALSSPSSASDFSFIGSLLSTCFKILSKANQEEIPNNIRNNLTELPGMLSHLKTQRVAEFGLSHGGTLIARISVGQGKLQNKPIHHTCPQRIGLSFREHLPRQ
ncbi:hypothetical protein NE865_10861 [Phthorimaea operculella]|nr:hypothetical protein NE865_10861 [Phthorimaea operculella]